MNLVRVPFALQTVKVMVVVLGFRRPPFQQRALLLQQAMLDPNEDIKRIVPNTSQLSPWNYDFYPAEAQFAEFLNQGENGQVLHFSSSSLVTCCISAFLRLATKSLVHLPSYVFRGYQLTPKRCMSIWAFQGTYIC